MPNQTSYPPTPPSLAGSRSSQGVLYSLSSYNKPFVSFDPFSQTPFRYFINGTIATGILLATFLLLRSKRTRLRDAAILSIWTSGIHHIDNFSRIPAYFLSPWIYDGIVWPLDIGFLGWHIPAWSLVTGVLLLDRENISNCTIYPAFILIWLHCFVILLGQAHYSVEHPRHFSASANASIVIEAIGAYIISFASLDAFATLKYGKGTESDGYRVLDGSGEAIRGASVARQSIEMPRRRSVPRSTGSS